MIYWSNFQRFYIVVKEAVLDGQEGVRDGSIVPLVTCVIGLLIRRDATCQVQLDAQMEQQQNFALMGSANLLLIDTGSISTKKFDGVE